MIPLAKTGKKNGCYYSQIRRDGDAALYCLRYHLDGRIIAYEVFRIDVMPIREVVGTKTAMFGDIIGYKEKLPRNEQFGSSAWSYDTLEEAEEQYLKYLKRRQNEKVAKDSGRAESPKGAV